MKITKSQLRQIIKEELEKVSEITSLKRTRKAGLPIGDFTNYELDDLETDHVMIDLLRQIVDEVRESNEFMRNLAKPGSYEES